MALSLLLFTVAPAAAQDAADTVGSLSGVEIRTAVNKAEIYVGDQITYSLTITYDSAIELIPPPLGANLGAFQVLDYQTDRTEELDNGQIRSTSEFEISTFTTGDYVIPPVPVAFNLPDGSRKVLLSEPVPIEVKSLLAEGDSLIDIKPIAAPYEFERSYAAYYIAGAVAVLLLAGLVYFILRRRRRGPAADPVDLRPPWEIAFERLLHLQQQKLIEDGAFKRYYYELSEILRWYLGRMYNRNVLDMTTAEFLDNFAEVELPNSLFDGLEAFFTHADLVKFARYEPSQEQTHYDFEFVHSAIGRVKQERDARLQSEEVTVHGPSSGPAVPTGGGQA